MFFCFVANSAFAIFVYLLGSVPFRLHFFVTCASNKFLQLNLFLETSLRVCGKGTRLIDLSRINMVCQNWFVLLLNCTEMFKFSSLFQELLASQSQ